MDIKGLRLKAPPVRLFILGARAESSLPRDVWLQLGYMFPGSLLHLIFIGPESMANRDAEFPLPKRTPENPFGGIIEDRLGAQMKITTYVDYFHTMYKAQYFQPFDPYFDCIVLFHPGLGHPASSFEWEETLPQLLETKVPILCTGYTQWDMERDINWVHEKCAGEFDMLLEPGENIFRSLRWDLNDLDPHDVSCGNWGLWAFRGKRCVPVFLKNSVVALPITDHGCFPADTKRCTKSHSRLGNWVRRRLYHHCLCLYRMRGWILQAMASVLYLCCQSINRMSRARLSSKMRWVKAFNMCKLRSHQDEKREHGNA